MSARRMLTIFAVVGVCLLEGPFSEPSFAQDARTDARERWLLFPVALERFTHISSHFGTRKLNGRRALHRGVDLVAPSGAWVLAAYPGTVTRIGEDSLCGWYVRLEHLYGWQTVYCHMADDPRKLGLEEGQSTTGGQVIGTVGSTGRSTGAHLHFSVRDPHGRPCDPLPWLFTPRETWDLLFATGSTP